MLSTFSLNAAEETKNAIELSKLPPFEWPSLAEGAKGSDGKVTSNDLQKDSRVLQFWASWCTTCGKTMIDLHQFVKSNCPSSTKFMTVNVDETIDTARAYFKHQTPEAQKLIFASYFDKEGAIAEKLLVKAIPTTLFIRNSHVILSFSAHPTEDQLNQIRSECQKP